MILAADPNLSRFLDRAAQHSILTADEEKALIILAQRGHQGARQRLCTHNLKFIIHTAHRYRYSGMSMGDLVNEGACGLNTAIDRYKPDSGFRFMSYAVWWIRQSITSAINTTSRTIRITSEHEIPLRKIHKTPLRQAIGGEWMEDVEPVAKKAKIAPSNLHAGVRASSPPLRLDQPVGREMLSPAEVIPSPCATPDQDTEASERMAIINRLRGKLPPVQRYIVTLAFGLEDRAPLTLREIGVLLDLSHERVRQLRNEALEKMRRLAAKYRE